MKISTRGRYALRVLVDLAEHSRKGEYVPLREIAQRQDLSDKYLESVLHQLVQAGILVGTRGKRGGYRMGVAPESCTVAQVLRLTERQGVAPVACLEPGAQTCSRAEQCRTRSLWKTLDGLITDYLESVTLADLMEPQSDESGD